MQLVIPCGIVFIVETWVAFYLMIFREAVKMECYAKLHLMSNVMLLLSIDWLLNCILTFTVFMCTLVKKAENPLESVAYKYK